LILKNVIESSVKDIELSTKKNVDLIFK